MGCPPFFSLFVVRVTEQYYGRTDGRDGIYTIGSEDDGIMGMTIQHRTLPRTGHTRAGWRWETFGVCSLAPLLLRALLVQAFVNLLTAQP
jgi:hypothetical protein